MLSEMPPSFSDSMLLSPSEKQTTDFADVWSFLLAKKYFLG